MCHGLVSRQLRMLRRLSNRVESLPLSLQRPRQPAVVLGVPDSQRLFWLKWNLYGDTHTHGYDVMMTAWLQIQRSGFDSEI
jgi:hypothetical protein